MKLTILGQAEESHFQQTEMMGYHHAFFTAKGTDYRLAMEVARSEHIVSENASNYIYQYYNCKFLRRSTHVQGSKIQMQRT